MTEWVQRDRYWTTSTKNLKDLVKIPTQKVVPAAKTVQVKVRPPSLAYVPLNRNEFCNCEYDLAEISRAISTEALLRRSISKHVTLCLKEGWDVVGKNPTTVSYIRKRLMEFELATIISFDELLRDVFWNTVAFSNAFLVFRRDFSLSSGRNIKKHGKDLEPIAGVFTAEPSSMKIRRNRWGEVKEYEQVIDSDLYQRSAMKHFDPEDVLHISYDKMTGFAWGTPFVLPVLDDIRILRNIEELANLVCHKGAFPLYHYQIGTDKQPAIDYGNGVSEVTVAEEEIQNKEAEGVFVTSHRHKIVAVDGTAAVKDLTSYLEYFQQRVISGLNLSTIDLGMADSSNRATAATLSKQLQFACKDFQKVVRSFFLKLFDDLLDEGGFRIDSENRVHLHFPEIDIESQQIVNNHQMALYQGHLTTRTEARLGMGLEPVVENQEEDMFLELVEKELIDAKGEAATLAAEVKAKTGATANANQPANQRGRKSAAGSRKNDMRSALIEERITRLFEVILENGNGASNLPEAVEGAINDALSDLLPGVDIPALIRPACFLLYEADSAFFSNAVETTYTNVLTLLDEFLFQEVVTEATPVTPVITVDLG
jgi:hypothetical protein